MIHEHNMLLLFISSGDVRATKDTWLVGNHFLFSTFTYLQKSKSDAYADNQPLPYLYQHYNIEAYFQPQLKSDNSVIGNLFNSLMDGFNEHYIPAKYILMFIDWDIICDTNFYGLWNNRRAERASHLASKQRQQVHKP